MCEEFLSDGDDPRDRFAYTRTEPLARLLERDEFEVMEGGSPSGGAGGARSDGATGTRRRRPRFGAREAARALAHACRAALVRLSRRRARRVPARPGDL